MTAWILHCQVQYVYMYTGYLILSRLTAPLNNKQCIFLQMNVKTVEELLMPSVRSVTTATARLASQ